MASRVTGSAERRAAPACLVLAALVCWSATAAAQSEDAGAGPSDPADPHAAPAAIDPSAEPAPPAAAPATTGPAPLKTLTPQQSSSDNLQGWLRERNRRRPTLAARPPVPAVPALSTGEAPAGSESALEGYRRRLRSFDEHGVTVLSNRHTLAAPALPRAQAAAAVVAPAPAPAEPESDAPSITETRSLRANSSRPPRVAAESGLGWPMFAVPVAAIGLALIWLRKRRAAD